MIQENETVPYFFLAYRTVADVMHFFQSVCSVVQMVRDSGESLFYNYLENCSLHVDFNAFL